MAKDSGLQAFSKERSTVSYFGDGRLKEIDISRLEIPTADGSIATGGGHQITKLSKTMSALGTANNVSCAPFCIDGGYSYPEHKYTAGVMDTKNNHDSAGLSNFINDAIKGGQENVIIPINSSGHASLEVLKINTGKNIEIMFFDSQLYEYQEKYNDIFDVISELIPKDQGYAITKATNTEHDKVHNYKDYNILHLLHQGDEGSAGCGYYSLYTAMLIRDHGIDNLLADSKAGYLFNEGDANTIQQHLIVLTMAAFGAENVSKSQLRVGYNEKSNLFGVLDPYTMVTFAKTLSKHLENPEPKEKDWASRVSTSTDIPKSPNR